MAQLLVLRQAIAAKEAGECEHPAQALEEMQERFTVYKAADLKEEDPGYNGRTGPYHLARRRRRARLQGVKIYRWSI
jgi:hypothetical protein